jgi:myosin-1
MEDIRRAQVILLAVKIQSVFRGWKERVLFQKKRGAANTIASRYKGFRARTAYQKTRAHMVLITSYWRMWKERKQLTSHMGAMARAKAAILITKVVRGWVVRKRMAKHFRKNAGPVLLANLLLFQKKMWLRTTGRLLPPTSPSAECEIVGPPTFNDAISSMQRFYHEWRCRLYRERIIGKKREALRAKLLASKLFKGRKLSYPESIALPFVGDHAGFTNGELATKWAKVATQHQVDKVEVASKCGKVNRSNGQMVDRYIVLAADRLLLLDDKLRLKYDLPLASITKLSTTSQGDSLLIVHVDFNTSSKALSKGDHVLYVEPLIELVMRIDSRYKTLHGGKRLPLEISDNLSLHLKSNKETNISIERQEDATLGSNVSKQGVESVL